MRLVRVMVLGVLAGCADAARPAEFVYVVVEDRNFEVYRAVDDSTYVNLTNDPALDYRPGWSWDGRHVLFYSNRSGNYDVFQVDSSGGDLRNLTGHPARDINPDMGPDGRIAFVSDRDGNRELYLMDGDGSHPVRVTENEHYDDSPDWSPDGSRLVYTSIPGEAGDIYVMHLEERAATALVTRPGHDDSPAWSPDGSLIAFNNQSGDTVSIYIVRADGSDLRRLPNRVADERHPRWSPDGAWLLYTATVTDSAGLDSDVWMMRPDGSERRALVTGPARQEGAVWRPVRD